jgi:hypothetical protein
MTSGGIYGVVLGITMMSVFSWQFLLMVIFNGFQEFLFEYLYRFIKNRWMVRLVVAILSFGIISLIFPISSWQFLLLFGFSLVHEFIDLFLYKIYQKHEATT